MAILRRMVAGLLLLLMLRSALTVNSIDLKRNFSDPTLDRTSNYSKVTCDFARDTCGWQNVEDYPRTWERKKDSYMRLKMKGAGDSKGRLASPWLPPLQDHSCRLGFQYYIQKHKRGNCQLSLYRQVRSGKEEQQLWSTQRGTGLLGFSDKIYQDVDCAAETFRMVFEGWRACSWAIYNEIDVKSIKFFVYPDDARPPTDPTPIEVFTIEHVPTDHGGTTEPSGKGDNHSSSSSRSQLNPGVLAAIIVIVVAVVVVIVGVLIVVLVIVPRRRRRRRQRDQKDNARQHTYGTTTNSTQRLELQHVAGNGGTDSRGRHPHTTRGDNYEVANLPPPAVVPDDTYDHTSGTGAPLPAAMPLEDTYDHTSGTGAPLSAAMPLEDTYDHTSRTGALPPAAMPLEDTYDHTSQTT